MARAFPSVEPVCVCVWCSCARPPGGVLLHQVAQQQLEQGLAMCYAIVWMFLRGSRDACPHSSDDNEKRSQLGTYPFSLSLSSGNISRWSKVGY
jgi:hypothetical protein